MGTYHVTVTYIDKTTGVSFDITNDDIDNTLTSNPKLIADAIASVLQSKYPQASAPIEYYYKSVYTSL